MKVVQFMRNSAPQLFLIAINCVLALGGALVLYVGIYTRNKGWVDVIEGYWSKFDDAVTALIVVGAVIIGLAGLGSLVAICRWRFGLCAYAIVMLLFLILFVIVTTAAFILWAKADDWSDSTYPVESTEETVKDNFDQVYCYAQGQYICNEASVSEALAMFVPQLDDAMVARFENMTGGVNSLCDNFLSNNSQLASLCNGCDTARQFENYSNIFDWAEKHCPRTNETLLFCGELLATGSFSNIANGTAPYAQCRANFLDLIKDYSLVMGIGGLLVGIGALLIIISSCYLRRREPPTHNYAVQDDEPISPSIEQPPYQFTKVND